MPQAATRPHVDKASSRGVPRVHRARFDRPAFLWQFSEHSDPRETRAEGGGFGRELSRTGTRAVGAKTRVRR